MKTFKTVLCASLGSVLFLGGCTMAPKYTRPTAPVAPAWPPAAVNQESQRTASAPAASDLKWQDFFLDAKLRQVVETALKNNRDLRMAALNVERVQAQYRIQRAQLYPSFSGTAGAQIYREPKGVFLGNPASMVREYSVGGTVASWELDFFGRLRSLKKEALEQYLATDQARLATQIALVASVAESYLALAADRDSLRLAQLTLDAQRATYDLIVRTRDEGIASDLDLKQAQSQVDAAQVDISRYGAQVSQDENALNLLVGSPVPANLLPDKLGSDRDLKDIRAGLPSEVMLRRPDILMAEHQLRAAYANIGAARAAFFPQITLTGSGGVLSSDASNLFTADSGTWTFAPQLVAPIFDAGVRRANLKVAHVDRDTAVAEYEKAIQSAFREVSDSLTLRGKLLEEQTAQQSQVNALDETYRLSDARYKEGTDSYLSVLVAQRSLYAAQQSLINVRLARLSNLVTLYEVLGGGE